MVFVVLMCALVLVCQAHRVQSLVYSDLSSAMFDCEFVNAVFLKLNMSLLSVSSRVSRSLWSEISSKLLVQVGATGWDRAVQDGRTQTRKAARAKVAAGQHQVEPEL